jgi:hypothetical protein
MHGFETILPFLKPIEHLILDESVSEVMVMVSTVGPEGPTKCSGLDVVGYDEESLHKQFGVRFRLKRVRRNCIKLHSAPHSSFSIAIAAANEWCS